MHLASARHTTVQARRGFTLVELLGVMILLGIMGTAVMGIMVSQIQFYHAASEVSEVRGSLRRVAELLPSETRAISPVGGDIYAMSDSALEFRYFMGSSVVCTLVSPANITLTIPPTTLQARNALTRWSVQPASGDSLFVFDDGTRTWRRHVLTTAPVAASLCPMTSGYTRSLGEEGLGWTLTVSPALTATTLQGAPIRIFRRARYSFYQPAPGKWYLGYMDCLSSRTPACSATAPVVGPLLPYVSGGASGLSFAYFDTAGVTTNVPASVARISITARATSRSPLHAAGFTPGYYRDSVTVLVALRNR